MGIIRGSHFYIHLITQKRPEYIVGIRPPYLDEVNLTLNTYKLLGNQQLRDIYHFANEDNNLVLHTPKLLGSQRLRDIKHEYYIDENIVQHTPKPLGNQQLKFVVLVGQNRFDGDEDMDRWKHNPGALGNQELKEIK